MKDISLLPLPILCSKIMLRIDGWDLEIEVFNGNILSNAFEVPRNPPPPKKIKIIVLSLS